MSSSRLTVTFWGAVAAVILAVTSAVGTGIYAGSISARIEEMQGLIGEIRVGAADRERRLREVEITSAANEQRSLANTRAIDERLRTIEGSIQRIEAWLIQPPSAPSRTRRSIGDPQ